MNEILLYVGVGLAGLGVVFFAGAVLAFRRRRWIPTLGVSTQGYGALTAEDVAATVTTTPTGPRELRARVQLSDGRDTTFQVAGDQVLVDAEYGSAPLVDVDAPGRFEVRVSTSGLLIRDVPLP